MPSLSRRGFAVVPASTPQEIAVELRQVREEAITRHSEVDLLVAALREHIDDLRFERDRLLEENAHLASELESARLGEAAAGSRWLVARQKPNQR